MTLPAFAYSRAVDLPQALESVADGAVPFCGGTELLAAMSLGLLRPDRLVSLRTVPELRGITQDGDMVLIGACATHREVERHPIVRERLPLLATVTRRVGNVRVRATGTLGGNLAFAEPRSDIAPTLLALGARVVVGDGHGERRLAIDELIRGPYESDLQPGEILLSVEVPTGLVDVGVYRKETITERPLVGAALVRITVTGGWRLVIGAVGETLHVTEVDRLDDLDPDAVATSVDVLPDHGVPETYLRRLTRAVVGRSIEEARLQATVVGS